MKSIFIIILVGIPLFSFAQRSIKVEKKKDKGIEYLQFSSDSCSSVFINKLNEKFGYQQSLIDIYNEAPNSDDKKLSAKEIIKLIDDIRSGKIIGSLASIEFDTTYNKNNLLSIKKIVMPEGEKKSSNSTVSEYPYAFPKIYDLKYEKEIKSASYFLTADGIQNIQKTIQKVMYNRAKIYFENKNTEDCHMGSGSLDDFINKTYIISNNPSDIDIFGSNEKTYCHFIFTETGMELSSSELDIQALQCYGPGSGLTIPWFDLKSYCINKSDNTILNVCNSQIKGAEKTEWTVKSKFANFLDTPDELASNPPIPVIPYIVKGEKVHTISKSGAFLKIRYLSGKGKEIIAWVKIADLE